MPEIVVVDYCEAWPREFQTLRTRLWAALNDIALAIEHVGSTAVPGLAAKPILDVSVVVPTAPGVLAAIQRLAGLDYVHRGNLGIAGREAFFSPAGSSPHHLYVCPQGCAALRNHLAVRDYLRSHPGAVAAYAGLKRRLALQFPDDVDGYVDGKTEFLLEILRQSGFSQPELEAVGAANRRPG